jgi:cell division protein ZapB
MVNELNALESKITQVVSLCRTLRAENSQLKQRLAKADAEQKALNDRMELARQRLEQLAEQLPEAKTSA